MKNPIKDKIRKMEAIGELLNEVEADLMHAKNKAKQARDMLYNHGFNAEYERIVALRSRIGTLGRDVGLFVDAALAELRLRREELRKGLAA